MNTTSLFSLPVPIQIHLFEWIAQDPNALNATSGVCQLWNQKVVKIQEKMIPIEVHNLAKTAPIQSNLKLLIDVQMELWKTLMSPSPFTTTLEKKILHSTLLRYVQRGDLCYGRNGSFIVLPIKNLIRFAKELARGEGHQPKENYTLFHSKYEGYGSKDGTCCIYAKDRGTPITPLDYFKEKQLMNGGNGAAGPNHDYQFIYKSMLNYKKTQNPNNPQLKSETFGEDSFYDKNNCQSSPQEKASAVFQLVAKQLECHLKDTIFYLKYTNCFKEFSNFDALIYN